MKFRCLPDHAVVKPLDKSKLKYGNIILPDIGNEKVELGEVIDPGIGIYNYHTDKLIPTNLKVGDIIIIPKMGAQMITLSGVDYCVCQLNQLGLAIEEL